MDIETGTFFISDITGYTQFLAHSELDQSDVNVAQKYDFGRPDVAKGRFGNISIKRPSQRT